MNFCSRYTTGVETKETRQPRNREEDDIVSRCRGKKRQEVMDRITAAQAHKYILANTDSIDPFRE